MPQITILSHHKMTEKKTKTMPHGSKSNNGDFREEKPHGSWGFRAASFQVQFRAMCYEWLCDLSE